MSKVRSSRGTLVDFDQLKIKAQLSVAPTTTEVTARATLVEERLNRRAARRLQQMAKLAAAKLEENAPDLEEFDVIPPEEDSEEEDKVQESEVVAVPTRKQIRNKGVSDENSSAE